MALFTEKGGSGGDVVTGLSIIGAGMRVVGDISAEGVVKIEGTVVGTVQAAKQVLVAKGGEVRGGIYAEERVELQATSVIHGDVSTKRLFVQEGGEINGVLRMGEDAGQPPQRGQRPSRQPASSTF